MKRSQGAVCAPEGAKPAQESALRVREQSRAGYTSSRGRAVLTVEFVDNGELYGRSTMDTPTILMELAGGGRVTGLGYAWAKCSACAAPAGAAN